MQLLTGLTIIIWKLKLAVFQPTCAALSEDPFCRLGMVARRPRSPPQFVLAWWHHTLSTDGFYSVVSFVPHSPLGIETMMTRHPLVQEEPRALPAVATLHTVGITAVSKVGEAFSFSLASCSVVKGWKMSGSQLSSIELLWQHKSHLPWESTHPVQSLARFFRAIPVARHLVTFMNQLGQD